MEAIGGETLDDSGFESERPDVDFDHPVEGTEE